MLCNTLHAFEKTRADRQTELCDATKANFQLLQLNSSRGALLFDGSDAQTACVELGDGSTERGDGSAGDKQHEAAAIPVVPRRLRPLAPRLRLRPEHQVERGLRQRHGAAARQRPRRHGGDRGVGLRPRHRVPLLLVLVLVFVLQLLC